MQQQPTDDQKTMPPPPPKGTQDHLPNLIRACEVRYRHAVLHSKANQMSWKRALDIVKACRKPVYVQKGGDKKGTVRNLPTELAENERQVMLNIVHGMEPVALEGGGEEVNKGDDENIISTDLIHSKFMRDRKYRDSVYALLAAMYSMTKIIPETFQADEIKRAAAQFTDEPVEFDWRTRRQGVWKAMDTSLAKNGLVYINKGRPPHTFTLTDQGYRFAHHLFTAKFHPTAGAAMYQLVESAHCDLVLNEHGQVCVRPKKSTTDRLVYNNITTAIPASRNPIPISSSSSSSSAASKPSLETMRAARLKRFDHGQEMTSTTSSDKRQRVADLVQALDLTVQEAEMLVADGDTEKVMADSTAPLARVQPPPDRMNLLMDARERTSAHYYREFFYQVEKTMQQYSVPVVAKTEHLHLGDFVWTSTDAVALGVILERKTVTDLVRGSHGSGYYTVSDSSNNNEEEDDASESNNVKSRPMVPRHIRQERKLRFCGLQFPIMLIEGDSSMADRVPLLLSSKSKDEAIGIQNGHDVMTWIGECIAHNFGHYRTFILQTTDEMATTVLIAALSAVLMNSTTSSKHIQECQAYWKAFGALKRGREGQLRTALSSLSLSDPAVVVERVVQRFGDLDTLSSMLLHERTRLAGHSFSSSSARMFIHTVTRTTEVDAAQIVHLVTGPGLTPLNAINNNNDNRLIHVLSNRPMTHRMEAFAGFPSQVKPVAIEGQDTNTNDLPFLSMQCGTEGDPLLKSELYQVVVMPALVVAEALREAAHIMSESVSAFMMEHDLSIVRLALVNMEARMTSEYIHQKPLNQTRRGVHTLFVVEGSMKNAIGQVKENADKTAAAYLSSKRQWFACLVACVLVLEDSIQCIQSKNENETKDIISSVLFGVLQHALVY